MANTNVQTIFIRVSKNMNISTEADTLITQAIQTFPSKERQQLSIIYCRISIEVSTINIPGWRPLGRRGGV